MFRDDYLTTYTILGLTLFSQSVIEACPENCNSCDEQDNCTSCKTGYWDLDIRCQRMCPSNCLNDECKTNNGFCISCNPGLYGRGCQRDCSLCEDRLCGSHSCTNGCKTGYYEYQDSVDILCLTCSQNCQSCSNTSVCNVCNNGFYLFKYSSYGTIKIVCVQCQGKTACSHFCDIINCIQCQIQGNSDLLCTQCIEGYRYNGQICIPNEINCAKGCSTDCNENGICQGSCNAGWTGERCSDTCASQCLKCGKNSANICDNCKGDYYTVTCDVGCNQSCIKEAGRQTCRQIDGYCYNGCENKFWGQNCNQSCPEGCADDGIFRVCDRDTGTCTNGCMHGYIGEKCETTISKPSTMKFTVDTGTKDTNMHTTATIEISKSTCVQCPNVANTDTKTSFITAYMSGVGTAVFVVVITTVLYHLRRRYIAKKSKPNKESSATAEMSTYYNDAETREPPLQLVIEANDYESLASNRNTEKVYSELESQAELQRHSYYNIDDSN